jgi:hypothetical protein
MAKNAQILNMEKYNFFKCYTKIAPYFFETLFTNFQDPSPSVRMSSSFLYNIEFLILLFLTCNFYNLFISVDKFFLSGSGSIQLTLKMLNLDLCAFLHSENFFAYMRRRSAALWWRGSAARRWRGSAPPSRSAAVPPSWSRSAANLINSWGVT